MLVESYIHTFPDTFTFTFAGSVMKPYDTQRLGAVWLPPVVLGWLAYAGAPSAMDRHAMWDQTKVKLTRFHLWCKAAHGT